MPTPNKTTGVYDVTIERGATYPIKLTWTSGGSPVNITGYTFAAQVWDVEKKVKYADFSVDYADRAAGKVNFELTPTQTATFRLDELRYDVKYKQPDNTEKYLIEGTIYMSEGYTTIS